MPTIGSLTAVFDAETGKFDAGLKRVETGLKQTEGHAKRTGQSLDNAFKTPSKSLADFSQHLNTVLGGHLGPLTQGVGTLSSSFTALEGSTAAAGSSMAAMAGPIGVAIAAFAAEITVVTSVTVGLFQLAKSAATVQGELHDLNQQTGVSVETLAALGELAKTTGGNLNTISQSLVVFQGNMEDAGDVNSKTGKTFQDLRVTITDTEQTLRDTLQAINQMPDGFQKTNAAAELFGRRGGKQMLAILKESKGDINAVIRELQGMGLANTEAARRADEFNDQLVKLDTQLTGLKVAIANEIVPTITSGLKQVERIIKENKDGIEALGIAAKGLTIVIGAPILGAIQTLGYFWKAHQPIINAIREAYEATAAAMQLVTGRVPNVNPNAIPQQPLGTGPGSGKDLLEEVGKAWRASQAALPTDFSKIPGLFKDEKKPRGAGGVDQGASLLRQLQSELRGLTNQTKLQEVTELLLDNQFKNTSATMREQLLVLAKTIDMKRLSIENAQKAKQADQEAEIAAKQAADALSSFLDRQKEQLRQIKFGDKTALDELNDFRVAFGKLGREMTPTQERWANFDAMLIDSAANIKKVKESLQDLSLVPSPAVLQVPGFTGKVLTDAQQAALGVPPPAPPDFSEIRRQMRELGFELTDIFSQSVGDGFNRGIKSGLATLSLGLLRIVEDVFLRQMAEGLSEMLAGLGSGGGGGNLLTKWIVPILGNAAGAGLGGLGSGSAGGLGSGLGGLIGRDSGGPIWPSQAFQLHKDEIVVPTAPGYVIPKGSMGQQVVNNFYNTFNMGSPKGHSYNSPRSIKQQVEMAASLLSQQLS